MYHKDKVVGLVLGSGMLAQTLVKNCKKKKNKNSYYIFGKQL